MEDILDMIAKEVWRLFKEWIISQWKSKAGLQVAVLVGMVLSLGIAFVVLRRAGEI